MDISTVLDDMRQDEEKADQGGLALHLKQGWRLTFLKKEFPHEWKDKAWEATGKRKSTHYKRLSHWKEFGHLIVNEEWFVHPKLKKITPRKIDLLLKVAKGTDDEVKAEHLLSANEPSESDLEKNINELLGKEVCDFHEYEERQETVCRCKHCNKKQPKRAKAEGGDS